MSFLMSKSFFFRHPQYKRWCNLCQQFFTWFFLFVEYHKKAKKSLDKRQCKNGIYLQNLQNCAHVAYQKSRQIKRVLLHTVCLKICLPYFLKLILPNHLSTRQTLQIPIPLLHKYNFNCFAIMLCKFSANILAGDGNGLPKTQVYHRSVYANGRCIGGWCDSG